MGEGTHTTPPSGTTAGQARPARAKKRWVLIVGGTVAAVLVAGILFQVFRPAQGQAQERAAPTQPATAGRASVGGQTAAAERPLARVTSGNSRAIITWEEVANECFLRSGAEVLENLINRKIIEQACEARGINVSEAEVDQEVLTIAKKFSMEPDQWYNMLATERNVSRAQYRRDIIWPMLALRKLAGEDVKVTKREMQEAFIHNYGERVKARVIVSDNIRRATEAWEKANANPSEFGRLVREYSIDSSSRALEGAVPPIARFSGNPASAKLEEEAFKLKEGEISPVIEVGSGQYVIILCEGRTEPLVTSMQEVERVLYDAIVERKKQESVAAVFQKLKDEARVDNFLTQQTTGGKKFSATTGTGTVRQVGGTAPAADPAAQPRTAAPRSK